MTIQGERYVQTIAVYREERVKVYGISERSGMMLVNIAIAGHNWAGLGELLQTMAAEIGPFQLVTGQAMAERRFELQLILPAEAENSLVSELQGWPEGGECAASWLVESPVTMLYLHGPHFQDRFGIAETALGALASQGLTTLVAGCAGTSMYLVTAAGQGTKALQILKETFLIPTAA